MKLFIGLCGSVQQGIDSPSRGEGRWALNLVRCLKDYGHTIVMAPDMEPCSWGKSQRPSNVTMIQPYEKRNLYASHFDAAIFTSWLTPREEANYIDADKYLWGVMGWKSSVMVDGYFSEKDYVIRFGRDDLNQIPYPINFRDRCFLLTQPFGKQFGESKFDNHRIAWVAKESFMNEVHPLYSESAQRHFFAIVDACKETGYGLSIFNSNELDSNKSPRIKELGIMDKLSEIKDVRMYANMPYSEYHRELCKCSITVPFAYHGSSQEVVFNGLVPMLYNDGGFGGHSWVGNTCLDLTRGKSSKLVAEDMDGLRVKDGVDTSKVLSVPEISEILVDLLTERAVFNQYLQRLRPMVIDNIDDHVAYQFNEIMKHNSKGK